ncbi:MAG: putative D,D-dipeptide transport ATP-binding protein DdpD [Xylophilus sp.]|nr:MAG: putative D,D-dipeptide transport ATP-binding protein DdpD [Xylophilus sp.]
MSAPLLAIEDLSIEFTTSRGSALAVSNVSLKVRPGEKLAIVGESGSGKTTTVMAALSLLPQGAKFAGGKILLGGRNVATASNTEIRGLRGRFASIVFQNARAALNPVRGIGDQIIDTILAHTRVSHRTAKA